MSYTSPTQVAPVMMLRSQAQIPPNYHLRVVQQPLQASQTHGPGRKVNKKSSEMIDPPVVIELHDLSQRDPRLTLNNHFLRLMASLEFQKTDSHGRPVNQPEACDTSSLRGERIGTPQPLRFQTERANAGVQGVYTPFCKDKDHREAAVFVFSELQCYVKDIQGQFRLRFDLFEMDYQEKGMPAQGRAVGMVHKGFVHSEWFAVYRPKDYPGRSESTDLVGWLNKQGIDVQKHRPSKGQRTREANARLAERLQTEQEPLAEPINSAAQSPVEPAGSQVAGIPQLGPGLVHGLANLAHAREGGVNTTKRRRLGLQNGRLFDSTMRSMPTNGFFGGILTSGSGMTINNRLAASWPLMGSPAAGASISAPSLLTGPTPFGGYLASNIQGPLRSYGSVPGELTMPGSLQMGFGDLSAMVPKQNVALSLTANNLVVPHASTAIPGDLAASMNGITAAGHANFDSRHSSTPVGGDSVMQLPATPNGLRSLQERPMPGLQSSISHNNVPLDSAMSPDGSQMPLDLAQYDSNAPSNLTAGTEEETEEETLQDESWMEGSDPLFGLDFS